MTLPNAPVVNAGLLYVNGLQLSWASNTTLNLSAGHARDSSDTADILLHKVFLDGVLQPSAVINGAVVGPNGVDQAVLANNTFYAVYVIASSTSVFTSTNALAGGPSPNPLGPIPLPAPVNPYPAAGLLSLASNAQPYLPFGYDMYRRVGYVSTDGSAHFLKFWQFYSNDQSRQYWYDVPRALGASTTGSTSYVKAPIVGGATATTNPNPLLVPPHASQVFLNVSLTANAAGDVVSFLPYGSTSTGAGVVQFTAPVISTAVALGSVSVPYGVDIVDYPTVDPIPVPVVLYKTTSASDVLVLTVTGFLDLL